MKNFLITLSLVWIGSCSQTSESKQATLKALSIESFTSPTGKMASLPHLIKGDDDKLYLSWVEKDDSNLVYFKYSRLDEEKWSEPVLIAKGNDWFVNWADYPMIAVDKDKNMMAHYLVKSSSGTYSYDVNVVIKAANKSKWSEPIIPHTDRTPTEHGFVTMLPINDGSFLLSWLDGRNTGGGEHNDSKHGSGGAMTIRTASLSVNGELSDEAELDNRVCDCCQTGGTMTDSGPLFVYRDRSKEEIRDMSFIRKIDNKWTSPKSIAKDNWKINGCPVNGPRISSYENQFATAWFTAANNQPTVKVAFGTGQDFEQTIIVDSIQPLGRVDIVMLDKQSAIISWIGTYEGQTVIKAAKVNVDGSQSPPFIIAEIHESRGSGFPQMEVLDSQLYFAWTAINDKESSVLMKVVSLN